MNSIVSCANLVMMEPFDGSCFRHALSKVEAPSVEGPSILYFFHAWFSKKNAITCWLLCWIQGTKVCIL
jgi:hypothetical protein